MFDFDGSLLSTIFLVHFTLGFMRLLVLGMYVLFNEKLGLQPAETTLLIGITITPWLFKILMAICSDSVTLCGIRRKSYLIINSIVYTLAIIALMAFGLMLGKEFILFCIIVLNLCLTWLDTLAEALIAQSSRFDLKNGAANLHILMVLAFGFGATCGCRVAGFIELR